jgi:oligopeptide/dipeptide ABC transporter ATP-binding protein
MQQTRTAEGKTMNKDNGDILLDVRGLKTHFFTDEGVVRAVDGVDFTVKRGQTVCLVGESGCGKSVTALSILQLVGRPGQIVDGSMLLHRSMGDDIDVTDLAKLNPRGKAIREIRGKEISMIFQEPMTSLSAMYTIGNQIMEAITLHLSVSKQETRERAIQMLRRVGIPKPEDRIDAYPFELSGGMRQRAMIAMALSCGPSMLIADEPTTALDVTTQANILDLIVELQHEFGMAVLFITHNQGVVAEIADQVVVMYLGQVVEYGDVDAVFHDTRHPYARALLQSIPSLGQSTRMRLQGIEERTPMYSVRGMVPHPFARPEGCQFHPRCDRFMEGACDRAAPTLIEIEPGHFVRCWLYADEPRSKDH